MTGTKHQAFGFRVGPGSLRSRPCRAAPGSIRIGTAQPPFGRCARERVDYERARTRARGDWELSAKKRSETEGAGDSSRSKKPTASDRGKRTTRSGDLGRALRSVYDDTLRETVPDDFLNLLGKLS